MHIQCMHLSHTADWHVSVHLHTFYNQHYLLALFMGHVRRALEIFFFFLFSDAVIPFKNTATLQPTTNAPATKIEKVYLPISLGLKIPLEPVQLTGVNSSDIYFSILSMPRYHRTRLSVLLFTWLQTVNPDQVYYEQVCDLYSITSSPCYSTNETRLRHGSYVTYHNIHQISYL